MYSGSGAITVRLEYDGKVSGLFSVSIPREFVSDEEELALFEEVASEVAFALHSIELERQHKQAEQDKRKLEYVQRLEALGTLAGGIAHHFNNLLMGIMGNISLTLLDTEPTHPHYERLKNIERLVDRGSKLIKQLLGFARRGRYEVKPIDLNQIVEETSRIFTRTKGEITIHRELNEKLFEIEADKGQIEQVLLDLFVNASDAMPGGGDLFLKTMNVTDKDMAGKPYTAKPGNYVLLTVRDVGSGMDKKTMERIFDPFFTTKSMSKSTGLGLASVYGIIKAHGGYIDVYSEKGRGSSFYVYLPGSEKNVEKAAKSSEQIVQGRGAILLVDDEAMVLDVGVNMLRKLGYNDPSRGGGERVVNGNPLKLPL